MLGGLIPNLLCPQPRARGMEEHPLCSIAPGRGSSRCLQPPPPASPSCPPHVNPVPSCLPPGEDWLQVTGTRRLRNNLPPGHKGTFQPRYAPGRGVLGCFGGFALALLLSLATAWSVPPRDHPSSPFLAPPGNPAADPSTVFRLVPPMGLQRGLGMPAVSWGRVCVSPGARAGWRSPFSAHPPPCTSPCRLSSCFFFFSPSLSSCSLISC